MWGLLDGLACEVDLSGVKMAVGVPMTDVLSYAVKLNGRLNKKQREAWVQEVVANQWQCAPDQWTVKSWKYGNKLHVLGIGRAWIEHQVCQAQKRKFKLSAVVPNALLLDQFLQRRRGIDSTGVAAVVGERCYWMLYQNGVYCDSGSLTLNKASHEQAELEPLMESATQLQWVAVVPAQAKSVKTAVVERMRLCGSRRVIPVDYALSLALVNRAYDSI